MNWTSKRKVMLSAGAIRKLLVRTASWEWSEDVKLKEQLIQASLTGDMSSVISILEQKLLDKQTMGQQTDNAETVLELARSLTPSYPVS